MVCGLQGGPPLPLSPPHPPGLIGIGQEKPSRARLQTQKSRSRIYLAFQANLHISLVSTDL